MTLSLLFYVLMVLWLFFGVWGNWPNLRAGAPNLLLFVLILLLGIRVFGPPIQG